jgi:hypothetical protein
MKLYKTTVTIWSEFDPSDVELSDLAREADQGEAYCSSCISQHVETDGDPDWDGTEFFHVPVANERDGDDKDLDNE